MRLAALTIPPLILALAACQSTPDLATLPHATLAGTHVDVDSDRVDTFQVVSIDGRNVLPITDQPVKLIGHDTTQLLPAGLPVHVEIEGYAAYYSTLHRLAWDPMRAKGIVEFVPAAGATYSLHGVVNAEASSVWIEDNATHEAVGRKLVVPGRGAAGAASGVEPTLRSGGA
ncbi:hypothetical protein [Scleromatobacter humisilvae]|uniref:Lipoprotein n=1 Tax=Scleromatobacter humisilvae TaxID=2897159 RepID=A0A9X1YG95_9BURK|nr:hypothetical protein [Scleromatobacter humisilvae]MCK9684133.1 hypothetical protein [Scleromatobacter humisilvae]